MNLQAVRKAYFPSWLLRRLKDCMQQNPLYAMMVCNNSEPSAERLFHLFFNLFCNTERVPRFSNLGYFLMSGKLCYTTYNPDDELRQHFRIFADKLNLSMHETEVSDNLSTFEFRDSLGG